MCYICSFVIVICAHGHFHSQDNSLAVAGGDNNVHIMDLESGIFKVSI